MGVEPTHAKNIAQQVFAVHPHQGGLGAKGALGKGEMVPIIHFASKNMQGEFTKHRGKRFRADGLHQLLPLVPIFNQ